MSEFKRLEPLIEYMNANDSVFGWKSRCEALTELAESLETELADKDRRLAEAQAEIERKNKIIEQMREALKEINSECGVANFSSFDQIKHAVIVSIELSDAALAAERGDQ